MPIACAAPEALNIRQNPDPGSGKTLPHSREGAARRSGVRRKSISRGRLRDQRHPDITASFQDALPAEADLVIAVVVRGEVADPA
jgi:hypothetical protein